MRRLYEQGHCSVESMHSWHCRCESCDATDQEFLFHAQTDSSCSGEVISHILHHDPDSPRYSPDVFAVLQAAALEVDAEPGFQAGFHVHVGMVLSRRQQSDAFWAFLRNEPTLMALAAGRFDSHRGNNDTVRGLARYGVASWAGCDVRHLDYRSAIQSIDGMDSEEKDEAISDLFFQHTEFDRHNNLNVATGHGTWEFRLWNSTRAAWRMELFTRLSVALVDPFVVDALLETPLHDEGALVEFDPLIESLMDHGHDRAAELAMRQVEYLDSGAANDAPSTFTLT